MILSVLVQFQHKFFLFKISYTHHSAFFVDKSKKKENNQNIRTLSQGVAKTFFYVKPLYFFFKSQTLSFIIQVFVNKNIS